MQTLTFTQKLLRQRRFLSSLIPLLALFLGLGASQSAMAQEANFAQTTITVGGTSTSGPVTSKTYFGQSANGTSGTRPSFNGASLGNYDINTSSLNIIASSARINVSENANFFPVTVTETRFLYRVYLQSPLPSPLPPYTPVVLPRTSGTGQSIGASTYSSATSINVLTGLTSGGTYIFEIVHEIDFNDNTDPNGTPGNQINTNPSGGVGYKATFTVVPPLVTPPGGTTTWISTTISSGGTGSTDWSTPSNWSNGVPNQLSNAVIPDKGTSPNLVYPILDGVSTNYAVNNLTLSGTSSSTRAELTIQNATLSVFGDLRQPSGGLRGVTIGDIGAANNAQNSTIIFAGADQVVSGRLSVPDVIIAGSGTKSIVNTLLPTNTLSFRPSSVANGVVVQSASQDVNGNIVSTNFDTTGNSLIDLTSSGIVNLTPGSEETISSYVRGVLRASNPLTVGITQEFGNIGLEMTPNHSTASPVVVFRIVDDALQGPLTGAVPIRRRYEILGDDNNSTSTSDIEFRYLPSIRELNGIPEANLVMFRTVDNGIPYVPLGGVVNTTTHVVTRNNLVSISRYILVLGDRENPLPVRLTAFDAQRVGANSLITWQTASEVNSKGYDIQVSTNGTEYRTLTSVPSASPNSTSVTNYRYEDKEANKTGLRYYRLRQVDLDGKEAFFAPKSVSFSGKASETTLVAYPNPFNGNDELHLAVQVASAGKGQLRITDMTGRTIRQETVELTTGLSDLKVAGLNDLKSGVYLIRVTLPTGENKNLKVVKQ